MRRVLIAFVLTLFWASSALAQLSMSTSTAATGTGSSSATVACALPGTTPDGALLVIGALLTANETATISSVSDSVNGSSGWTLVSGPADDAGGTMRSWFYYRENSAEGSITITLEKSGSETWWAVCGYATGAATSGALGVKDETPPNVSSAGVQHDSDALVASRAGAVIGFLATNVNHTVDALGTNEVNLNTGSFRGNLIYEPFASGGTYNLEATVNTAARSSFHSAVFLSPAAASGASGGLLLRGVSQ